MEAFSLKDIRELAKLAGLYEKGVKRMLGSLRVSLDSFNDLENQEAPDRQPLEIGLRLNSPELYYATGTEKTKSVLAATLSDYKNTCPQVVQWIGRGDFNPSKLPQNLGKGRLIHANRSAGRLRAEFMRKLNSLKS